MVENVQMSKCADVQMILIFNLHICTLINSIQKLLLQPIFRRAIDLRCIRRL